MFNVQELCEGDQRHEEEEWEKQEQKYVLKQQALKGITGGAFIQNRTASCTLRNYEDTRKSFVRNIVDIRVRLCRERPLAKKKNRVEMR